MTGNRDMGVAIFSKPLAAFFTKVLKSDMKLETDAEEGRGDTEAAAGRPQPMPTLVEAVPELLPDKLFPSKTFDLPGRVRITPVLSPDNYMSVVPDFLRSATKSIYIENQYIRSTQPEVSKLLEAIRQAREDNPELDVRIILGKLFSASDVTKEKANVAHLKAAFGLKLGENIRYIDTKRFVHCHNKVIIVDEKEVLVSSQNWSDSAVSANREAGVIIPFAPLARYYTQIFESDWSTAQQTIPRPGRRGGAVEPETVARGGFVEVSPADYQEV